MSSTPGNRRIIRDLQRRHTHSGTFRRRQRQSSSQQRRSSAKKLLRFDNEDNASCSKSSKDGDDTPLIARTFTEFTSHSQHKPHEGSNLAVSDFWANPPPPPPASPVTGEANTRTVNRRSLRLRERIQFPFAQISDSRSPTLIPRKNQQPTSDLILRKKTQNFALNSTSDYGTSSENSLYFRPSAQSSIALTSVSNTRRNALRVNTKSKNHQSNEPSSQSIGYGSDLDEALSNLSFDDAVADHSDDGENNGQTQWERVTEEEGIHFGLDDLRLKDIKAVFKTYEGIGVLTPLDGYLRTPKRALELQYNNIYHLRSSSEQLKRLLDIQTYKIDITEDFLRKGIRIFQVSPIISIKPHDVQFIPLLPATIQIPLETDPSVEDEVHCLHSRCSVEELPTNYTKILWKSAEAGKFSIINGKAYYETFHFGLFVLIVRQKCAGNTKHIRARVGGKLIINDIPSIEISFPKEATEDSIRAEVKVFLDTEKSISEFLEDRCTRYGTTVMETTDEEANEHLATPILQLEPHGMNFTVNPVRVTLPVPDYLEIMKLTNQRAKLTIWQSNTHSQEVSVWERLDVQFEISQVKLNGQTVTIVTFPVTHFSFFKGVWEAISDCLHEAKLGMLYFFVSFAMKCQANMEEYDSQTTTKVQSAGKLDEEDDDQQQDQSQICGGTRFGLEVSMFQADKPWPEMATYKYKVGQCHPKLIKPGRILIRLKSNYFEADVEAGEDEEMVKEETDFRGRDFEKQFICKFKPLVRIARGPFGKVLVTRTVSSRQKAQTLFEFNIQKHGNESEVSTVDYKSEQWSIVALRELANNLFVTDGDNWKHFAEEAGMTKQEIKDANLKHNSDPFEKIVSHYRNRGGTPEELVDIMYRCNRTIKIKGNFSPPGSSKTKSSNGSSGRGSLSSNNAHFDHFGGSHDSDTSGKTSGTRTSQDSGLPPGRKRPNRISNRGSSGGGSLVSKDAKRRKLAEPVPGTSQRYELQADREAEADEEDSDSDSRHQRHQRSYSPKSNPARSLFGNSEINARNDMTKLDSNFLWQISEELNVPTWRAVGRTLGMEERALIDVDHMYSKVSFRECSYQMLLEFKQRYPGRCTFGTLYTALNREGMKEAAKKMNEIDIDTS